MFDLNEIIENFGNEKVKAIKLLREAVPLSLKEAKDIIDESYNIRKTDPNYDLNDLLYSKLGIDKVIIKRDKNEGKNLNKSGVIDTVWNSAHTKILRYQQEISHSGLNEHKVISAPDKYILQNKVDAQHKKWSEKWEQFIEKEEREKLKEFKKNRAIKLTKFAENELQLVQDILFSSLGKSYVVDWDALLLTEFNEPSPSKPEEPKFSSIPTKPDKSSIEFTPNLGLISGLIPYLKNKAIREAEELYNKSYHSWELQCKEINRYNENIQKMYLNEIEDYNLKFSEWNSRKSEYENQQLAFNKNIELLKQNFESNENSAIIEYFNLVLNSSNLPFYIKKEFELEYNSDTKILIVDYMLPNKGDLPSIKEYKYIINRDEIVTYYQTDTFMSKLFEDTIYKLILRILKELFDSDYIEVLECISFNGWVNHINEATGKLETICIASIQANKEDFQAINLSNVVPKECFKNFKGVSAAKLGSITPIQPILIMNKNDRRFISSYDVTNTFDDSTNLAAIPWEDFEHLIRELFEMEFSSNGGEVKVTQASRDGGVDAVAFDPDPLRGGKIVIQAKRYTNVVGVAAVRDLYGTLINEGASRGILVTTSDYGSDSYEFAKNKPLTLLTGSHLLSLLEKHGHKAKIDLKEAKILNQTSN